MRTRVTSISMSKGVTRNTASRGQYSKVLNLSANVLLGKFIRYRPDSVLVNSPEGFHGMTNAFRVSSNLRG